MIRSTAIAKKCLECCGSSKEVTLCHIFDCPLWQFRFGTSLINKTFDIRMQSIKTRYPKEFEEIKKIFNEYYENIADNAVKAYVARFFGAKLENT